MLKTIFYGSGVWYPVSVSQYLRVFECVSVLHVYHVKPKKFIYKFFFLCYFTSRSSSFSFFSCCCFSSVVELLLLLSLSIILSVLFIQRISIKFCTSTPSKQYSFLLYFILFVVLLMIRHGATAIRWMLSANIMYEIDHNVFGRFLNENAF